MEAAAAAAAGLCCVGACALALYLYHVLWVAPERVRAALRGQGIGGPRLSFPYGNRAEMRQAAADAKAAAGQRGGIVHDYRPALFPHYERWRKEYGPIFTYSIGNMVFLHASRPDVVRDLGLCVSLDLGKSSYMKVTHRPLFGDGILKSSGEAWAHQRRLIAPEFFPDKVRGMVDLMLGSARALVGSWEDRITSNNGGGGLELELKIDDDIRAYSADVISMTCFGSSYVKGKEIFAMIREMQKLVSKPNLLAEMIGLSFLPTRTNRAAWRLNRQVHKLLLDVVRQSEDDDKNMLNAMLRSAASSAGGDGSVAAEDFIVDNSKKIYFAGYETTAVTTAVTAAWCMMLLALHPEWQRRVRDEVRQACAGAPDFTSLQKMKKVVAHLTMVIQETLRLYPAGSVVSRQALCGVTLGGVRVPAGVNIYVPVSTVHLDPELWGADAREFDPERFAGARQPPPHAYLPFGVGARTCLGQSFAMAELKVLLALVLSRFELRLSPAYVHSPALRLIVEPEHGVRLVLRSVEPRC
ncbi:Cytochrome P450 714B1 [Dichanthelium oligosanthes]|uniref:Cytochrome P450 714B1 n=1 Tax=Dichanthelium oligosanthes TaxID=888268 RepID=A0A1E5VFC3_9POAL|nr:Cytochrome P450 714B1 [Dichanthelium oligosanthes]